MLCRQCAPVLAGIKPSNLLITKHIPKQTPESVLSGTSVCCRFLYASCQREYWLLFDPAGLLSILKAPDTADFLQKYGYRWKESDSPGFCLLSALDHLTGRLAGYCAGSLAFPHEMGIFFGYPLSDVQGFIAHQGRDFKCSGYWKVYDDPVSAQKIFACYDYVKDMFLDFYRRGIRLPDICRACKKTGFLA